ncbi:MAG: hypothetical protein QOD55_2873 [Solirubrobacteraceae bacterium]|nr:hypothetical protein [Solirubrobacteraceae bacterium]
MPIAESRSEPKQPRPLEKKTNMRARYPPGAPGSRTGRAAGGHCLCRWMSLRPMTMRWISEVPSPIRSSGASRYRRSISYSLE